MKKDADERDGGKVEVRGKARGTSVSSPGEPSSQPLVCPPAQELLGLRTGQRRYHVGTAITHPLVSRSPLSREWGQG